MLNGIFGKWLREFATLVLTQTVQAFLLAIVMTVIISCLGNASSSSEGNQAAGLLAIIALASFGKIELLVKNIFGVTSQFGDPSLSAGARGLTAGTMLAMRGGKRLLDNGTKMVDAQRKISEAKKGLTSLGAPTDDAVDNNATNSNLSTNKSIDTNMDSANNTLLKAGQEVAETSIKLQGMSDLASLNSAINRLSSNIEKSNGNADGKSKREKYEQMLKEGKDMRRSAIRENVAGAIGGTAGAIVGLAKGDNIIETTLAGAGAGDALGEASAKRKAQRIDYNQGMKKLQDKIEKMTVEEYNKSIDSLEKSLNQQGLGGIKSRAKFEASNSHIGGMATSVSNSKSNTKARIESARAAEAKKNQTQDK